MIAHRAVLVVLDGLGVGAMEDADARDAATNTLRSILACSPGLTLPNLAALGLADAGGLPELGTRDASGRSAWGVARLGYQGADTYLGHQAMMGAPLGSIEPHLLEDRADRVRSALEQAGHSVTRARPDASVLVVDGVAYVADNIEAAPGLNVNVTGSADEIPFSELLEIGRIVRENVAVPRVIVVGGRGFGARDIDASITERRPGHVGIDTPRLGVYDANYEVRHLGGASADAHTLPNLVVRAGRPVVLLGKAADVVECAGATRSNDIPARAVFDGLLRHLTLAFDGLIVANVQETDLAGHEQDPIRFADVLRKVDERIPDVLAALGHGGVLLVAADHGNDPLAGHSQHTRERVPVLAVGAGIEPGPLGERSSLSDIGATIAELLAVGAVADGTSFAACAAAQRGTDSAVPV